MSRLFAQLGAQGFLLGVWETVYMTLLSTAAAYLIGLPLGILLCVTDKGGVRPVIWLNKTVGFLVNILRSIPFIILMVALIPVARAVVGTSIGNAAMIFMLIVAAAPYIARMVESSVKEVDGGVIEAARSMGEVRLRSCGRSFSPKPSRRSSWARSSRRSPSSAIRPWRVRSRRAASVPSRSHRRVPPTRRTSSGCAWRSSSSSCRSCRRRACSSPSARISAPAEAENRERKK